jgi:hypothetical protein
VCRYLAEVTSLAQPALWLGGTIPWLLLSLPMLKAGISRLTSAVWLQAHLFHVVQCDLHRAQHYKTEHSITKARAQHYEGQPAMLTSSAGLT